jgi:hypothetical protein
MLVYTSGVSRLPMAVALVTLENTQMVAKDSITNLFALGTCTFPTDIRI